ncbi:MULTISPECIES: LysR family transcriptional regulator [unclassified Acidiphilium]|uniref:LysR family transcriptional regulator n=1 Tax=unclassified Acidiphilium TaxID=2617493 RepID=UPI000BD30408|nr:MULTISPECIES: LysR family transcriptional regulator [unclassified Acidiphilium]OZB21600.1 MAG: LysR family transcriptional regulator [Acidiphilium sp. 34-64-41]
MDRFHELNAFISVAEAGGFSAAARRGGDAQPAISKAVAALEKRLGVALFHRNTRSVTLTDQGQRYYDRAKPLLDEMNKAETELTNSSVAISGTVRISVAATFGRLHVLPLIPKLLSLYPDLHIDLILSDFVRDMVEDRVDLAIRVGRVDEPDAVAKFVVETPLVCVGSRRYFAQRGTPKIPADLLNHNCLVYNGLHEAANWTFIGPNGQFSVTVRGSLSSNSVETIRMGVLAGVGIGLFAKVSLAEELAQSDVITVLDDFVQGVRDISLVWPKRRFVPERVRCVTDFLAKAIPKRL